MSSTTSVREPKVLVDGLAYVESPRWHEGRLWFAHWGRGDIIAVDTDGNSEVVGHGPPKVNAAIPGHSLGWSIDWLPDGRLLITGKELVRREPDGSIVRHADLSDIASFGWNEIVVDGRGNVYVNSIRFGFIAGEPPTSGIIALVSPDGSARTVADDLAFPNGMVITPDNSTLIISESFGGRLAAFDIETDGSLSNRRVWAEGLGPASAWTPRAPCGSSLRIRRRAPLSGSGRAARCWSGSSATARSLPPCSAERTARRCSCWRPEWRGIEHVDEAVAARSGQVLITKAPAPGAGWP